MHNSTRVLQILRASADLQKHRAAKLDGVLHLAQQVRHGEVEHPEASLSLHVLHPFVGLPLQVTEQVQCRNTHRQSDLQVYLRFSETAMMDG